jgi:CRISPR-associated protein Csy2
MSYYLLLPQIRVQTANAHATSWLINTTPLFALNMFGHNLGRQLETFPSGVAVIHHDAQLLGESGGQFYGRLRPQQRRGASFIDKDDYPQGSKALSFQPTASCHLKLSLVLAFNEPFDVEDAEDFLAVARIAGGQVISFGKPKVFCDEESLRKNLKSGYWLIERSDLMDGPANPLEAMIQTVGNKAETTAEGELPRSWIVPTVLGYAAITDFEKRSGVREGHEGYSHAFCEPLVGLVQYVTIRQYGNRSLPFWRHQWLSEDVFVIQQQKGI